MGMKQLIGRWNKCLIDKKGSGLYRATLQRITNDERYSCNRRSAFCCRNESTTKGDTSKARAIGHTCKFDDPGSSCHRVQRNLEEYPRRLDLDPNRKTEDGRADRQTEGEIDRQEGPGCPKDYDAGSTCPIQGTVEGTTLVT